MARYRAILTDADTGEETTLGIYPTMAEAMDAGYRHSLGGLTHEQACDWEAAHPGEIHTTRERLTIEKA